MMNLSRNNLDAEDGQAFRVALAAANFCIQVLGTLLILGVISYEHYGLDPQKRTVLNQLLSGLGILALAGSLIPMTFINVRLIFGPLDPNVAGCVFFVLKSSFAIAGLLMLDAMLILRYLTVFVWKKVIPISDGFFSRFLFSLSCLVGFCFGIWGNMGHNLEHHFQYAMTSSQPSDQHLPTFRFYRMTVYLTVMIHLVAGVQFGIKKAMDYRKLQTLHPMIGNTPNDTEPHQPPPRSGYNTNASNVDLTHTLASVILLCVLTTLVVNLFLDLNADWTPVINCLAMYSLILVVAPLMFWLSHPGIYKFIWDFLGN